MKNNGKPLEALITMIGQGYEQTRVARIRKTDPPTAFVRGRVVHTANPWPDFVGSWTQNGGRLLMIEAKSTTEDFLPIMSGGVREAQVEAMRQWAAAGAVCFVLWAPADLSRMRLIPIDTILARASEGPRRIRDGEPGVFECERGTGKVAFDFMATARLRWT